MDSAQFRAAAHAAVDEIADYFDNLPDRRVNADVEPGYLAKLIPKEAPQKGEDWSTQIAPSISDVITPGLTHWQHPNFMAFFPIANSYPSILGELYSAAYSAPGFNWECSPVMTDLETIVMGWLGRALHLPEVFYGGKGEEGREIEGGGVIQGSASEALLTCMVCARERYIEQAVVGLDGRGREVKEAFLRAGRMVALASEQCHSSAEKAARVAGVKYRSVPVDWEDDLGMKGQAVEQVIQECENEGLEVFFLVATVGTTATCATDRVSELTKTLAMRKGRSQVNGKSLSMSTRRTEPQIWLHVDAAYAGAAFILPEYAHLAQALDGVDSVTINLHKWLLVNFDCSALFVKNKHSLTNVLSLTPSYLRNDKGEKGLVTDYRDWQIPLGRRFRSLKIWFVMRTYGIEGMREHLRKHIELGERFAGWMRQRSDLFRIVTKPAFALTVFTIVPLDGTSQAEANTITTEVCRRINASGELMLTTSVVKGVTTIRVVSANMWTNEEGLRRAFELIAGFAEKVRKEGFINGLANGNVSGHFVAQQSDAKD